MTENLVEKLDWDFKSLESTNKDLAIDLKQIISAPNSNKNKVDLIYKTFTTYEEKMNKKQYRVFGSYLCVKLAQYKDGLIKSSKRFEREEGDSEINQVRGLINNINNAIKDDMYEDL